MKRLSALIMIWVVSCFINLAFADPIQHFKGKPADTLQEAVANLAEYNHKLELILNGEITNEALEQVHILSYTLENALEKINEELTRLADTLEELHVASEEYDPEAVLSKGREYLSVARQVIQ